MSKIFSLAAKAAYCRYVDTNAESSRSYKEAHDAAEIQFEQLQSSIPGTLRRDLLDLNARYENRQCEAVEEAYLQGFADGIKFLSQAFGYEGGGVES